MTAPYVSEYVLAALQRARLPIAVRVDALGAWWIWDPREVPMLTRGGIEHTPDAATRRYLGVCRELMP